MSTGTLCYVSTIDHFHCLLLENLSIYIQKGMNMDIFGMVGIEDGKAEGYEKAMEDLKPILPVEMQQNMNQSIITGEELPNPTG